MSKRFQEPSTRATAETEELSMKRIVMTIALTATAFAISACNTVAGAGKDVSSAGNAVSKTANDSK